MAQYRTVDKTTFTEIGKWTKEKIDAKGTELSSSINNKVDKVEGSGLATTAQLTQIETNKTDITSLKSDKADKSALTDLATKDEVSRTYATKEELANLGDLKGSCLKSELEGKMAECKPNDMYIVTDDSNHIWYYTGTEFVDTSAVAHVDLSNYYDKGSIDSSLSKKVDKVDGSSLATSAQLTQIETNKTDIAGLKSGKVDNAPGKELVSTTDITQITTNKNSISTLQGTVDTINSDLSELATFLETYA